MYKTRSKHTFFFFFFYKSNFFHVLNTNNSKVISKDLGSLNINIHIFDNKDVNAILDLCARINLILYLLYLQLGVGEWKPITMSLQLIDKYVIYSKGLVKDLMVEVDNLIVYVDFEIAFVQETLQMDKKHNIIFSRPFGLNQENY